VASCTRTTHSTSGACAAARSRTARSSSTAATHAQPYRRQPKSAPPPDLSLRGLMGRRRPTRISLIAAVLLIAALGVRIAEVELTSYSPRNDAGSYLTLASQIAHTGDYSTSRRAGGGAGGTLGPSAYFPPAFPYLLAAVDLIGGNTGRRGLLDPPGAGSRRPVIGTATVAFVGLVAFELFDATVALIALGLAAFLIRCSSSCRRRLVAENLMTLLILAAVWIALSGRRSEHPYRWIAAAGVLTGLATLAHVNSLVMIVPLAFAAWHARRGWRAPALLVVAALLTVTPWLVRKRGRHAPVSSSSPTKPGSR